MPVAYGYHNWSGATTESLGSITLAVPDSGCIIWLNGSKLVGDGNLSVNVSGFSIITQCSIELSSFEISVGGYAKLYCSGLGQWAIIEGNIDEHLAA